MSKKLLKLLSFVLFLSLLITSIATGTLPVVAAEEAEIEHKAYAGEAGTTTEEPKEVVESDVAASGTWGGIDWTLTTDGTLTIAPTVNEITKTKPYSKTNPKELYQVGEVPAAVNDAISAITGWPFNRTAVKKLVIEEGVTSIGSFALQGLTNLTGEVVIPSTVTYIGQEAFQKSPMTKLTFAKGGTGELCIGPGAFKALAITELVLPEDRSSIHIHCWAFNGCSKLEKIVIPANVDLSSSKTYGWTHAEYEGMDYVYAQYAASSDIFATCPKITSIDFGSEEVKTNFFKMQGNQTTFNKLPNVTVEVKAPSVAQIGEQGFETLADAIAAATAGQTITFLADITENITVSKSITIDGANKNYTGTMTLNAAVDFTVQNVNFANGTIVKPKGTPQGGTYTIKGCDFEGQNLMSYAIDLRSTYKIIIEDSTAKGYAGFLQVPNSNSGVSVKNVVVDALYYGFKIDYSGTGDAVIMENVTVNAGEYALYHSNYGEKTHVIKNCTLNGGLVGIALWNRNTGYANSFRFEGNNTVSSMSDSQFAKYVLAAGATLTAPEAINVTTNVEDGTVVYKDGKYYVQTGLEGSGTAADPYQIASADDLVLFRDSVNAGETKYSAPGVYVALTADIDLAGINWVGIGSAYKDHGFMGNFDGKGFKIMNLTIINPAVDADGYAYAGLFSVTEGIDKDNQNTIKNLIIENVTISTEGHIVSAAIAYPYYTIVDNVTVRGDINISGGNYTAGALAYTRRCVNASNVTVSGNAGSTITGVQTVGGVISDIQMNGGLVASYSNFAVSGVKISGEMNVGGISGIISAQALNGANVKNVELVCSDARVGVVSGSLGGAATITGVTYEDVIGADDIIGATYDKAAELAAKIGDTYYATFDAAMKAANAGDIIVLLVPIVVEKGETLVIDLKGATILGIPTEAKAYAVITNRGNLTIKDSAGGGAIVCDHKLAGSTSYAVNTIVNSGTLTIEGGLIENKSTASNQIGYAIDNNSTSYDASVIIKGGEIKASGSNYYDAIRLFCNNLNKNNSVTVEGGKVSSIWLQNPSDGATKDTKDVKGSVTITGGTVDALYLEPSSAFEAAISGGYVGKVEYFTTSEGRDLAGFITGGTFGTDVTKFVADGYVAAKNADGTYGVVKTTVTIGSVEDLLAFAAAVTGNTEYQGIKVAANSKVKVLLTADLDLAGSGFVGIGNGAANTFSGTFDGQGHTISNMTLSCNYTRGVGFFRSLGNGAVVKNVTFVNANVNNGAATAANHFYGVVAGFSNNLTLDNVNVKDSTVTCKYSGAAMVGCLEGATVIKNSNIENVTLTTTDIRAAVYGIIGNSASGHTITVENNTVTDTKLSINGEIKPLAQTVGYGSWSAGQDYAESMYVAMIGNTKYSTLTAAIKAANAGDVITLVGDVNGNVTIDKSITIDGAGFKYTGTLTVNDNLTVTVQNVNFVNGGIAKTAKSAKGNYTIKGCTFTDNGKYAYALSFKGANKITVEDCAVSNYMYGFLYVSSGAVNVSVKNVTVENCSNYAVYFASGVNTASFEDLTVKNSNNGFILNNTANREFTVNNCTMENVVTAINSSKGTNAVTCNVLGVNDFGGAAISQYAKLVGAAQVGNVYYGDFAEAFAAAQDGDTIKLLGDIAIDTETFTVADGKKITLDMNGKKITATDNKAANASYELFYIYGEMIVTGNGTIELTSTSNDTAWAKSSTIFHNRGGVLTIENGTFTHKGGTCMAFVVDNSGNWYGDAVTNINGGALNSSYIAIRNRMEQNTHGASGKAILNVYGGKIDGISRAIWAQAASTSTKAPATGEINIFDGTIGLIDTARSSGAVSMTTVNGGTVAAFKGESGELTVNGGKVSSISIYYEDSKTGEFVTTNYKVKKDNVYYAAVAKIGVKYFATLQDAVDAAKSGDKIMLVANSKGAGVVINKSLTLDFYGYTYVLTSPVGSAGTETLGFQILAGGFDENRKPKNNVTVRAGTLKVAEEAADKFAILVQNYANLTVFGMNLDGTNLDRCDESYVLSVNCGTVAVNGSSVLTAKEGEGNYALDVYDYSSAGYSLPKVTVTTAVKVNGKINAGAKYSATVYYATYEQAVAANGNSSKNIKKLK